MQLGIAGSTPAQLPELVSTREGGRQIMTFGEAVIFALQRYEKARGAVHFIGDPFVAEMFAAQAAVEAEALALYKKDPATARKFLTAISTVR